MAEKNLETTPANITPAEREEAFGNDHNAYIMDARQREAERDKRNADAQERALIWDELVTSKRTGKILAGTIAKISKMKVGSTTAVCAVVMYKMFRVLVPAMMMHQVPAVNPAEVSDEERVRREEQVLQKMLGVEIPFCVTDLANDGEEPAIMGSRKQALTRLARRNFIGTNNTAPRIVAGTKVRANIISVGNHGLWACVGGIDMQISKYQISNRYMEDLTHFYSPGDKLELYVTDVQQLERGISISVDPRKAETEKLRPNFEHIQEGEKFTATITSIRPPKTGSTRTIIHAFSELNEVPILIRHLRQDTVSIMPSVGDQVLVVVLAVRPDERDYVLADAIRVVPKAK